MREEREERGNSPRREGRAEEEGTTAPRGEREEMTKRRERGRRKNTKWRRKKDLERYIRQSYSEVHRVSNFHPKFSKILIGN